MSTASLPKWRPIEDLPQDYASLVRPELSALAKVWAEQRASLSTEAISSFIEKLRRQWAIETGIIERAYSLDRGITEVLIDQGIKADLIPRSASDRDPEVVVEIIRDQEAALESLFAFVKGARELTASYVKELHALLMRHHHTSRAIDQFGRDVDIPLTKGDYKKWPNNPARDNGVVHEYCPPEQVIGEMERLVGWHKEHTAKQVPPEAEAAWLHHRFTQVHPFQDGNGRVARALATLVFLRAGWFPLVVTRDERKIYIEALEHADNSDLGPLVDLFTSLERKAFVGALSISKEVQQKEPVRHIIEDLRDKLAKRQVAQRAEWQHAKDLAERLHDYARNRFEQLVAQLEIDIKPLSPDWNFFVNQEPNNGDRRYYFRNQIIQVARQLGYFVNTNEYSSWVRIVLRTDTQSEILLSFHGIGHEYRGILAASMFFFRRETTEEGEREVTEAVAASDEVFQINYKETEAEASKRFSSWLEISLAKAIQMWRSSV